MYTLPIIERFNQNVQSKYFVYNSVFITLPFDAIDNTGALLPLFSEVCEKGFKNLETPKQIVDFFSIDNKTPRQWPKLHRVHEGRLDFFEHHDSEEKQRGGNGSRDSESLPWDCAAEEDGAETVNDGSHGVEIHEEGVSFRNHAGWVDDGGGIHGELDSETDEEGKIAVFCRERGDDDTGAKS